MWPYVLCVDVGIVGRVLVNGADPILIGSIEDLEDAGCILLLDISMAPAVRLSA